jgi:hypothetical protein
VKKPFLFFISILLFAASAQAQKIAPADLKQLKLKEDTLKVLAKKLIIDSLPESRMRNDSLFIRTLVRTLRVKNSFHYPMDSVLGISKLYAPDSTFRIISWSLSFDDYYSRQRAAIQFKTPDGSLKLVPLTDISEFTTRPLDSVRTKDNWIGAVYYNMVKTTHQGKNYYTLFGYDPNSVMSNKKWIDVLSFNAQGMPQFGEPVFSFEKDSVKKPLQRRHAIEYKKEASTFLNYDPELQLILVDHLISESDEPEKPHTFIPDGDYEGFKWENGKWVHIDKVFDFKLKDGEFPMPDPLRDQSGSNDEKKLQERTDKNSKKKKGN